jgi:transcriptional antiterminator RfaH
MDFWRDIHWFAIQTKAGREEIAAQYISMLGLEIFLPKMKRPVLLWGRPGSVLKPLFPNYLFARFCPANYLHLVQYARGVSSVVSARGIPLPVADNDIDLIRDRIADDGTVQMIQEPVQLGQQALVPAGPFKGIHGIFERQVNDHERVMLLLDAVHHHSHMLIEQCYLRKVAPVT